MNSAGTLLSLAASAAGATAAAPDGTDVTPMLGPPKMINIAVAVVLP
jgi:hypothetical protein